MTARKELLKYLANVDSAIEMWKTVPKKNVDLNGWRIEKNSTGYSEGHTCETIACFGGWCAVWPDFRKQGVSASPGGIPVIHCKGLEGTDVADWLFGDYALFFGRGSAAQPTLSDHQIVTNRLRTRRLEIENRLRHTETRA